MLEGPKGEWSVERMLEINKAARTELRIVTVTEQ